MSATEDDTELRDLLIHNLENNGILNKLKAEMRAAVFLAMEEQDKLENKTPLVNENLKKCLNTKDGRVVASLVIDFLQVFNLDFTLAVFQPEINSLNGLDSRTQVCCDLGMSETDVNKNSPLLLELTKSSRRARSEGDKTTNIPKELSPKQIADARKKFDFYDKDRSGGVLKEDVRCVFSDLFPHFNKNMLDSFISDELETTDKTSRKKTDFQEFLGLYKRLFAQCRTVVMGDVCEVSRPSNRFEEKMTSKIPRFRSPQQRVQEQCSAEGVELARGDPSTTSTSGVKGDAGPGSGRPGDAPRDAHSSSSVLRRALDLDVEEDGDEGDSFFDDPLPKPQKTYGCSSPLGQTDVGSVKEDSVSGSLRRGESLNDLSVLDLDGVSEHRLSPEHRRVESSRTRDSPVGSLSDPAPQRSNDRDSQHCRNGTSTSRDRGPRDVKVMKDRSGSLGLDEDVEYDDDFNSHRSDLSKSELSIGEEIEEVSIEGPDISDKFDETTQDLSVSQLSQTHGADYMEDVA